MGINNDDESFDNHVVGDRFAYRQFPSHATGEEGVHRWKLLDSIAKQSPGTIQRTTASVQTSAWQNERPVHKEIAAPHSSLLLSAPSAPQQRNSTLSQRNEKRPEIPADNGAAAFEQLFQGYRKDHSESSSSSNAKTTSLKSLFRQINS